MVATNDSKPVLADRLEGGLTDLEVAASFERRISRTERVRELADLLP